MPRSPSATSHGQRTHFTRTDISIKYVIRFTKKRTSLAEMDFIQHTFFSSRKAIKFFMLGGLNKICCVWKSKTPRGAQRGTKGTKGHKEQKGAQRAKRGTNVARSSEKQLIVYKGSTPLRYNLGSYLYHCSSIIVK